MPRQSWRSVFVAAGVVVVLLYPMYADDSPWIGVAIATSVIIAWHTLWAARSVPWIPGLISLVALLQWTLIPWAAYHVPPAFSMFSMALPSHVYFRYAVPAALALAGGLYLPVWREGRGMRTLDVATEEARSRFRQTCDLMILLGVLVRIAFLPFLPPSLRFVGELFSNLSYVGVFGLLLSRAPGWHWRAVLVFGLQILYTTAEGMFHQLLLWVTYFGAVFAVAARLRRRMMVVLALLALATIFVLNSIKQDYRAVLAIQQLTAAQRMAALGSILQERIADPTTTFSEEQISFNVTRLNQGWIIARVLSWVPAHEPLARGETVVNAVQSAFVPRVLFPSKHVVGGHAYFERFTGLTLRTTTSMDLSVAGEMYANFGRAGGWLGVMIFGIGLGLIFRIFLRWSRETSLWWAWAPFVMLDTMRAEGGLADAVNHVVKATIVMVAVIWLTPAWAGLRTRLRLRPSGPSLRPARRAAATPADGRPQ